MTLANIGVIGERRFAHRIVQRNALAGAQDVVEQRFGQQLRRHGLVAQLHGVRASDHLRGNAMLARIRQNQHATLGAGLFDGGAHDHVDEFFQDDFTRYRLGHLDHRGQVEVFDGRRHGRGWRESLGFGA
ncbi:hypothetical protein D3C73_835250 [compost metagenome]